MVKISTTATKWTLRWECFVNCCFQGLEWTWHQMFQISCTQIRVYNIHEELGQRHVYHCVTSPHYTFYMFWNRNYWLLLVVLQVEYFPRTSASMVPSHTCKSPMLCALMRPSSDRSSGPVKWVFLHRSDGWYGSDMKCISGCRERGCKVINAAGLYALRFPGVPESFHSIMQVR